MFWAVENHFHTTIVHVRDFSKNNGQSPKTTGTFKPIRLKKRFIFHKNHLDTVFFIYTLYKYMISIHKIDLLNHLSGGKMRRCRLFLLITLLFAVKSFAQPQVEKAPDSLFQRLGREDYATLKAEIFQKLPDGLTPNQTVEAVKIFKSANDMDALVRFLDKLDSKQLPDQKTWNDIFYVINYGFGKSDLAMEAFVLKSPFIPVNKRFDISYFSREYEKRLHTNENKPSQRQINAIKKLMAHSPAYFARMADCFPEECPVNKRLIDVLQQEKTGEHRKQAVERMSWRALHPRRDNRGEQPEINEKEVHEFAKLLCEFLKICKHFIYKRWRYFDPVTCIHTIFISMSRLFF